MLEKLRKYFLIYKNKCGKKHIFMKHEDEFIYCLTRAGLENTNKNVLRGNINIFKINEEVKRLLMFGDVEDFQPIDLSIKLEQPDDVKQCLKMLKNEKVIK